MRLSSYRLSKPLCFLLPTKNYKENYERYMKQQDFKNSCNHKECAYILKDAQHCKPMHPDISGKMHQGTKRKTNNYNFGSRFQSHPKPLFKKKPRSAQRFASPAGSHLLRHSSCRMASMLIPVAWMRLLDAAPQRKRLPSTSTLFLQCAGCWIP